MSREKSLKLGCESNHGHEAERISEWFDKLTTGLRFGFDGERGCAYIIANVESRKKIFATDKRGGSVYSERVLLSGRQGCGQ